MNDLETLAAPVAESNPSPTETTPAVDATPESSDVTPPSAPVAPARKTASQELDEIESGPTPERKEPVAKVQQKPNVPKSDEASTVSKQDAPAHIKELRGQYEKLKSEFDSIKGQSATAQAESQRLRDEMKEVQRQKEELENIVRITRFEESDEYKKNYLDPFQSSYREALQEIVEYDIEEDTGTRKATPEDLRMLLQLKRPTAFDKAKQMFGDHAPDVKEAMRKIWASMEKMDSASKEYREKGKEIESAKMAKQKADQEAQIQTIRGLWENQVKDLQTKYPQFFAPDPEDPEGSKFLETGAKLADMAFMGSGDHSVEDMVRIQADVRTRAAGFGFMVHKYNKASARVKELEKELAGYKKSEPKDGVPAKTAPAKKKSYVDELDEIERGSNLG